MQHLLEIDINPEFHISTFGVTNVRKFALYIPPLEKCLPTEKNYFGLEELSYGDLFIDQESGSITMSVRHFFKDLLSNIQYAYEISCTPTSHINQEFTTGIEILNFGRENLVSKPLVDNYLNSFTHYRVNDNLINAYRVGTILKRLYKGHRTTEMTDQESDFYKLLIDNKANLEDLYYELVGMEMDFQNININLDDFFPIIDKNFINEFLIRIHREYLKCQ